MYSQVSLVDSVPRRGPGQDQAMIRGELEVTL